MGDCCEVRLVSTGGGSAHRVGRLLLQAGVRVTDGPLSGSGLVVLFDEQLLGDPAATAGLSPGSTLLVNTRQSAWEVAHQLAVPGLKVIAVDATAVAVAERSRMSCALLGAISQAIKVNHPSAIRGTLARALRDRSPQQAEADLQAFDRAGQGAASFTLPPEGSIPRRAVKPRARRLAVGC